MTWLFYDAPGSTGPKRSGFSGWEPAKQESHALEQYRLHCKVEALLDHISKYSEDRDERIQARVELDICARKLNYWSRYIRTPHGIRLFSRIRSEVRREVFGTSVTA